MAHIFISYIQENSLFADRLRARLAESGFAVWEGDDLRPGDEWRETVDLALREAFAVVVVMSRAASTSPFIAYEWACGLGLGADVIPIVIEPAMLHPRLRALGVLDFTDARRAPWDELIGRLRIGQATRAYFAAPGAPAVLDAEDHALISGELAEISNLLLAQEDADVGLISRLLAVLGRMGGTAAVHALLRALPDERPDVRYAAADALKALGKGALPVLKTALGDEDARLREGAAMALARSAPDALAGAGEAAIPALIGVLRRDVGAQREAAVAALVRIGGAAVPALVRSLEDGDWEQRALALDALGRLGDPAAVPALVGMLSDEDDDLRARAASALGQIGDASALPGLIRALGDRDGVVRWWAAEALGRSGDPAAVPALLEALRAPHEDMGTRLTVVGALARLGDATAVPVLLALLRDEYLVLREAAARALGQIGDPAAVAGLEEALYDEQPTVREAALEALARLDTPGAREAVEQYRRGESGDWPFMALGQER
ncbi:MAG: HEAT repeat domain-containing protein [Anaerolineae bacterium]|nr:HEAT repeat domain-containing protein [Anaerolineae bacterium]